MIFGFDAGIISLLRFLYLSLSPYVYLQSEGMSMPEGAAESQTGRQRLLDAGVQLGVRLLGTPTHQQHTDVWVQSSYVLAP